MYLVCGKIDAVERQALSLIGECRRQVLMGQTI